MIMMIKKLLPFFLAFFLFFTIAYDIPNCYAQMQDDPEFVKLDLRGFTFKNPKPVVLTSDTTSDNWDPRFRIKGINKSGNIAPAEALIFPVINGGIFYKLNILQYIAENKEHTAVAMLGDEFINFAVNTINLAKTKDWTSNGGQFLDAYYFVPGNYQHFLNIDKKLQTFSGAYTEKKSVLFFAGISNIAPTSDPYFSEEIMKKLKTFLNIGENANNAFFYPTKVLELSTAKDNPIAFGACYEIRPAGETNKCLNTTKEGCDKKRAESFQKDLKDPDNAVMIELQGEKEFEEMTDSTYFAYGISCKKLDSLLNNERSQTQQVTYNMLIYFHGLFTGKEPSRETVKAGFEKTVFSKMTTIKNNFITVWMDQPKTNFLTKDQGGESWSSGIPFADIVKKVYAHCSDKGKLGGDSFKWDIWNQLPIKDNLTATVHCGYLTDAGAFDKGAQSLDEIKVFVAGHSAGGQPASQSIGNSSVKYTVILDGLYYSPNSSAKDCSKWWAIQTNKDIPDDKNGQKAIASWRTLCPNNIVKGSTDDHWQVPGDLPPFLMKGTDTNAASNPSTVTETVADTPLPDREKTIFKPQVAFGGITTGTNLANYLNSIYKYLLGFALVTTGFIIVLGGLKYMMGKADGLAMVKNAFIGLTLLAGTHLIMKTINPQAIELQIVEVTEIEGVSIKGGTTTSSSAGGTITGPTIAAGQDRSPDPPIAIGSDWYFPVKLEHVSVNSFKSNATSPQASGSFGYFRLRGNEHASKTATPVACHGGIDIYTTIGRSDKDPIKPTNNETDGEVYAITDGEVVMSGNNFHFCQTSSPKSTEYKLVGSIIIKHQDANGNIFYARYGEINVNCFQSPDNKNCYDPTDWKPNDPKKNPEGKILLPYNRNMPIVNLASKFPPGTKIKAGQPLGIATYCGMLHFELHAKPTINVKWRLPKELYNSLVTELQLSDKAISEKSSKSSCLASPSAVQYLVNDTGENHGTDLRNPSIFLTELWNKTGAVGKQKTD